MFEKQDRLNREAAVRILNQLFFGQGKITLCTDGGEWYILQQEFLKKYDEECEIDKYGFNDILAKEIIVLKTVQESSSLFDIPRGLIDFQRVPMVAHLFHHTFDHLDQISNNSSGFYGIVIQQLQTINYHLRYFSTENKKDIIICLARCLASFLNTLTYGLTAPSLAYNHEQVHQFKMGRILDIIEIPYKLKELGFNIQSLLDRIKDTPALFAIRAKDIPSSLIERKRYDVTEHMIWLEALDTHLK